MFCDLVGSTALSSSMDPEELQGIITAYQGCVAKTVSHFDGFVAKYMGDGVLVYFGYPRAHEDDAERAVRSGLMVVDAVGRLKLPTGRPAVRVGIATGLVVVGETVGEGYPRKRLRRRRTAARLQGLAEPNAVVIADHTRNLLNGTSTRRSRAQSIRGMPNPFDRARCRRTRGREPFRGKEARVPPASA
jgi:class 3 adenylate cyclase